MYRTQMRTYALAQCAAAQLILTDHTADGTGCCRRCGRPTPCSTRVDAQQRYARYQSWLTSSAAPVNGHPYRLPTGPHTGNAGHH